MVIHTWPPARRAQLALLLEVAGTPKPGNVDRSREYPTLKFEHFLAGAMGARPGLVAAADSSIPVGEAFERAVGGMACQRGGNTQFGALLLLCPLVRASSQVETTLDRETTRRVVADTAVDDAIGFYRAFEHVDVAVGSPPEDAPELDVGRGSDAAPAIRRRGLTLTDIMELSASGDGVAAEWTNGFERSFRAATLLQEGTGTVSERTSSTFLRLLAEDPDTFVATTHGPAVARTVSRRAAALVDAEAPPSAVEAFAESLIYRGINPGSTADIVAAGLYIALSRGLQL